MKNQVSSTSIYDTILRLLILFFIIAWCFLIMAPFLNVILWSLIFGFAIHPAHRSLSEKMGLKPKLASFLIVFSLLVIVILPSSLLVNSLVDEVSEIKESYVSGSLVIPLPREQVKEWPIIGNKLYTTWQGASKDLDQTIISNKEIIGEYGKKFFNSVLGSVSSVLQIALALIVAGFLLVVNNTGESIRKFFRKVAGERGDEFADTTLSTVNSVVQGVMGVAIIMGLLHGIIFLIIGVPFAGIWALLIFVLTVLQIPPAVVVLPVVVYLFAVFDTPVAIFWTVILIITGLSDNFLKPMLLGKGAVVPMLVIFVGVIGGFLLSGLIGLFTGAIVMSIGYKLFVGWVNTEND